jgi:hypothetical protein
MLYDHDSRRQLSREYQARLADDARRTRTDDGRNALVAAIVAAAQKTARRGHGRPAEHLPVLER